MNIIIALLYSQIFVYCTPNKEVVRVPYYIHLQISVFAHYNWYLLF